MKEKINAADMLIHLEKCCSNFFEAMESPHIDYYEPIVKIVIDDKRTELVWGADTYNYIREMLLSYIEEDMCDELLVTEPTCYHSGSGIWISEVPFKTGDMDMVFVISSDHMDEWSEYMNIYKTNTQYESVEYDELMLCSGNLNDLPEKYQPYCIKALSMLLEQKEKGF